MKNVTWNQLTAALTNNQRANFADAAKTAASTVAQKAVTLKDKAVETVKDVATGASGYLPVLANQLEKANNYTDQTLAVVGARVNVLEDLLMRAGITTEEELDQLVGEQEIDMITAALSAGRKAAKKAPIKPAELPTDTPTLEQLQQLLQQVTQAEVQVQEAPVVPSEGGGVVPTKRRLNFDRALES